MEQFAPSWYPRDDRREDFSKIIRAGSQVPLIPREGKEFSLHAAATDGERRRTDGALTGSGGGLSGNAA